MEGKVLPRFVMRSDSRKSQQITADSPVLATGVALNRNARWRKLGAQSPLNGPDCEIARLPGMRRVRIVWAGERSVPLSFCAHSESMTLSSE
jgi:hypothetical protein